jgi:hypothetical protein
MHCNRSAVSTKRRGNIGSPYLTPLLHCRFFPGTPLSRIEVDAEFKIDEVQLSHCLLEPNCFIMLRIELCSMVLKAFVKSNLIKTISYLDC